MLIALHKHNIDQIKNQKLKQYAMLYADIEDNFLQQVQNFGLPMDQSVDSEEKSKELINQLEKSGIQSRNDRKSFVHGAISSACVNCQLGEGIITFFVSLRCSRNCFFCFNPNQEGYQYYLANLREVVQELEQLHQEGEKYHHIALSGGEPLLHKEETEQFFIRAKELYPKVYTRLYTSGDFLDEAYLQRLNQAKLDEIRFSIKTDDPQERQKETLEKIKLAKGYIPKVMVEMPVLPEELEKMKELLKTLDDIGIYSINLLELCFPLNNAEIFKQRGYQIKAKPYRVLYNYWYAGALPIAGSEEACLELVQFAQQEQLTIGVHYCSLENKHTGQVYQQNKSFKEDGIHLLSNRDYFLKSAKVFGEESQLVAEYFKQGNMKGYKYYPEQQMTEFSVKLIRQLKKQFGELEIAICYHILEERNGEVYLRELKMDLTTPKLFQPKTDI